jgi:CRISPR-associated endonuclease/helicase Cas3
MDVTVQTGSRPEDRKLEGNLIFTTVDQTLSNFLNIPYALSLSQGNVNAGAVLSSYLVFDELHLYEPDKMLPTVLHLLKMLQRVVPFVVMTATLSPPMVEALAEILDAEALVLSQREAADIPSQMKTRRMHVVDHTLNAKDVLANHRSRSVAICNTVDRAQSLYRELRGQAGADITVRLLHSRFLQGDRRMSETWLEREFGADTGKRQTESAILVATQVVEVGLDITSDALHTELAPAASVIQRAGRCARRAGEEGDVYVYRLPRKRNGNPNYAPYFKEQRSICDKTWRALAARSGDRFDFSTELAVVEEAHGDDDRRLLEELTANRHYLAQRVASTIAAQEAGAARDLIREVDSRTVIVHPDPAGMGNPWSYEGFGIYKGTLFGAYDRIEELGTELDVDWTLMTAVERQEEESSRAQAQWEWMDVWDKDDLLGALLVAVNPRLASYGADTGFRLGMEGDPRWQSPPRETSGERARFAPYRRETFQEHVKRMLRVYEHPFLDREQGRPCLPLREELAYAARRLEDKYDWPSGILHRLGGLLIALHDIGKLDVRWQDWAHRWQEVVSELREEDLIIPEHYMAAHTDYDVENEEEKALNRKLGNVKPNHAVESARAAEDIIWAATQEPELLRAALSVIARHHSAGAVGNHGPFKADTNAREALSDVLDESQVDALARQFEAGTLSGKLARAGRWSELLPYLLLSRSLRLADQRSQRIR